MAGWIEAEVGSRHLARRSAERRRIEKALRLDAADLLEVTHELIDNFTT